MAFIYKIINDINNKVYIGKTNLTVEERWREHKADYQRERVEKRPLYIAMKKYGIEHFHIESIEQVNDVDKLCDREIYWIEFYRSFKYGYNATKGGDGKSYLDYDLIIATYLQTHEVKKTAQLTGASPDSVSQILHNANIEIKSSHQILREKYGKVIGCYKNNNLVQVFSSQSDAARWIINNHYSKSIIERGVLTSISRAVRKITKTAYGFVWDYL